MSRTIKPEVMGVAEEKETEVGSKVSKLGNQHKITANDSEKYPLESIDSQKFPSFHEILGPVLTVGQFFGNLPAQGVLDRDFRNISFKWSSFRTIYALIYLLVGSFEVCLMLARALSKGFNIEVAETIMFYGDSIAQSYIFLWLATRWKGIIGFWYKMERPFLSKPYSTKRNNLPRKIFVIGFFFVIFFLTEHLVFFYAAMKHTRNQLVRCNVTYMPVMNNYIRRMRPHLHDFLPYHWSIFPIFQWTLTCMVFCWNYVDFFLIILSLGISTRFNQLNSRLRSTPQHEMDNKFWLEIRLHYTNLVCLLEFIDERISHLVLLSMSHNLFLVCTKIFEAVKYSERELAIDNFYFYFYLFFLLFRTLILFFSCSSIHTSANCSLKAIRDSQHWSVNHSRLSDLIQSETVALSGNQLFYITRQSILSLVGTIITFELVLLDRGSRGDPEPLCAYFRNNTQLVV